MEKRMTNTPAFEYPDASLSITDGFRRPAQVEKRERWQVI